MGDIIHTLPAVAALREAFPNVTLGWLVDERWAELLCTLRYPRAGRRSSERPLVDRRTHGRHGAIPASADFVSHSGNRLRSA